MKVFITIIIILLLLRWILKPLIKITVQSTFSKMAEEARRQHQAQQSGKRQEGTISVDYIPEKDNRKGGRPPQQSGEYIDYEEIK